MLQNATSKSILNRLPIYLDYLINVVNKEENVKYISSKMISNELELGEVQVRKDLAIVCGTGKPKIGYDVNILTEKIKEYLGCHYHKNAIIIGVGKLGSYLIEHEDFERYGIKILAGFDLVEKDDICNIPIKKFNIENLEKLVKENKIDIGIICVPKEDAQTVCNILIKYNIHAIWNFAQVKLNVPKNIFVQNENLTYSLSVVSSIIKQQHN